MDRLHIGIIGGGPAGYVAALYAAAHGAQVTLAEKSAMGGTCLQRGCIPTKRLVAATHLLDKMRNASSFGIALEGQISPNWASMCQSASKVVIGIETGLLKLLDNRKVTLVTDVAYPIAGAKPSIGLQNADPIQVDRLLLCTGSLPHRPSNFEFDDKTVCTSDEIWQWHDLPKSLMIIGEGVIACEFAFIFQSLGVSVNMLGMAERPLPMLDHDISRTIAREMKKRRIQFKSGKAVTQLKKDNQQWVAYHQQEELVKAERVLVCTGRIPNSANLKLDEAFVRYDERGEIQVDQFMRTTSANIYAAGDVTGGLMLAHAASAQAKIAISHMLGMTCKKYQPQYVPLAVFTQPEVATVGLTEQRAIGQGLDIAVGTFDMRALGKAHAMGEISGNIKLVVDRTSQQLLGAHMVGANVTEMIHEVALIISQQGYVDEITSTIHAHPTLSEGLAEAAEDVFSQADHKPLKNQRDSLNGHAERSTLYPSSYLG